jgi:S-DNA-T family DNA segregation ATPase FtsK/SpoIIIE
LERFDRIVAEGPAAGVVLAVTTEHPAHLPASLVGACDERWVLRLADPADATLVGVPARAAPPAAAPPGRAVVWPALLEAQLAAPDGWPASQRGGATVPPAIPVLPADVPAAAVRGRSTRRSSGCRLFVGLRACDLAPVAVDVPSGEHLLVVGPPRSGRTSTLARLAESWREATGSDRVVWWSGRDRSAASAHRGQLAACAGELLLVVDDADLVDDPDGQLARLVAGGQPGLTVVASARPGTLRSAYGHWTHAVRRSRRGLLLDGVDELDADLLGAVLPRDRRVPARPGRGWLVVDGVALDVVQVARHGGTAGSGDPDRRCADGGAGPQASRTPSTMCTVRSQ